MKGAKKLLGLVLLACFICFITVSCQSSNTSNTSVAEPTNTAQTTAAQTTATQPTKSAEETSALKVDVFSASEKGALVASTLIQGEKEAILVDSQLLNSEAQRLVDRITQSGKTLKAIWITHGHPDHYFGLKQVLAKFPNTPVYATAEVVEDVRKLGPNFLQNLKKRYGDDVTSELVIPQVFNQNFMELDGERIEIIKLPQGDTKNTTAIHIPSINTVIAADVLYSGVHPFLVESSAASRTTWLQSLEQIKALNPKEVIPGHKDPSLDNSPAALDKMKNYLETFSNTVKREQSAAAAYAAMEKAFPNYKLAGFFLKISTDAAYKNR